MFVHATVSLATFIVGLGKFCGPFHRLFIELTGKRLASR